jgi:GntR family transcriptional regulator, transcriptional repressor for pyruvate dehydrogenase complex
MRPRPSRAQPRYRAPRLAEIIAGTLRERILSGEIADGELLPKQEDLLAEFRVSVPSIREAMRILETEGLIRVQRGNVGGALVQVPRPSNAAYTLGLVLQSRAATLEDVGQALASLGPLCVRLACERSDRMKTVLPALRDVHAETLEALDDPEEFRRRARRFHQVLVDTCGNATLGLMVGALESLWSAHEAELAAPRSAEGEFSTAKLRRSSVREHERLMELITAGDATRAERYAATHLAKATRHTLQFEAGGAAIRAALLRED